MFKIFLILQRRGTLEKMSHFGSSKLISDKAPTQTRGISGTEVKALGRGFRIPSLPLQKKSM